MKTKKPLLSVLTALMLVFSMFALTPDGAFRADAAEAYGIVIAGVEVTGINRNDILGDGHFSYDPKTKTLFVKGDLSYGKGLPYGEGNCIVSSKEGLTIDVVNDSTITMENKFGYCLRLYYSTKITGKGKLTLITSTASCICTNINDYAESSELIIEDADIECYSGFSGASGTSQKEKLIIRHSSFKTIGTSYGLRRFSGGIELEDCRMKQPANYEYKNGAIYDTDTNKEARDITIVPVNYIKTIDITIPEPKDGGIISENCDVLSVTPSDMCVKVYNTTGGKKNKVTWTNPPYLIQDGVTRFKNGTTYYLNFKLAQSYPVGDVPDAELSEKTVVRVNGRIAPGARPCKKTSPARRGFYILFITFAVKNAILK